MERSDDWDTHEAFDVLNADEGLYTAALAAPDAEALHALFTATYPDGKIVANAPAVNAEAVNWDQVYVWLHDEVKH